MDFPDVGAWRGSRVEAVPLWTLGLEPGLSIPHVTGRRMPEVLRAGTLCAKNNHDVCSAGRRHYSSITSKAWTLSGFALSSSCGLFCASPHLLLNGEGTEIWIHSAPSPSPGRVTYQLYPQLTVFKSGLNILRGILWLMTLRLTFLTHWMPVKCTVCRKDLTGVSMVCTCGEVETPWPRAEQSNWATRSKLLVAFIALCCNQLSQGYAYLWCWVDTNVWFWDVNQHQCFSLVAICSFVVTLYIQFAFASLNWAGVHRLYSGRWPLWSPVELRFSNGKVFHFNYEI